jgi:pimeloyl-ACP methyl ester carboxylesterase
MIEKVPFAGYALAVDDSGGDGAPVVLVHSTGMSSKQWKRLAGRLAPRHRVLQPDLLGYGESTPWPRGEVFHWQLDLLGIEALLDALDAPAHLIGHSYGGLVALGAALHRPRAVRSLTLIEPVAYGVLREGRDDAAQGALDAQIFAAPTLPETPGADDAWLQWFVDYWNGPGAWGALPSRARESFLATAAVCYGEVRSLLEDRTTAAVWATVRAPTLLLRGERSPEDARRVAAILARAIPGAGIADIAGAGHMAPITHEAAVAAAVEAHLAAH